MNVYEVIRELAQGAEWHREGSLDPIYVEVWERDEHGTVINKTHMPIDRIQFFTSVSLIVELKDSQKTSISADYLTPID